MDHLQYSVTSIIQAFLSDFLSVVGSSHSSLRIITNCTTVILAFGVPESIPVYGYNVAWSEKCPDNPDRIQCIIIISKIYNSQNSKQQQTLKH